MTSRAVDLHRRQLLRGRIAERGLPLRPPWSITEVAFVDRCERCDDCIDACEPGILVRGDGGFPGVDFRAGACTFCAACVDACKPQALRSDRRDPASAWSLTVQIDESCLSMRGVTCRACGDRCPVDAIRFRLQTGGRAVPELSAASCTACGACASVCPADAVRIRNLTREVAA